MDDPRDPPEPTAADPAGSETTTLDPPAGPPPPVADRPSGRWQLRRSVSDRKIKGVAGGVAAAADLDPTLVRLLFAVAALSGWGIVAYVVLAVVLRDETADERAAPLPPEQRRALRIGLAVAAVIAGARLLDGWFLPGGNLGLPLLLIAGGAAVLWIRREEGPAAPQAAAGPGAAPAQPTVPPPTSAWPVAPPPPGGVDWRAGALGFLRLVAAFAAVGAFLALVAGSFLVAVDAVSMRIPFLPAALAAAGILGLVVAVVRDARPAAHLVSGGVLVVAAALAAGLATFPDDAGTRIVVIGPGTPLLDRYELDAGRLVLDLSDLPLDGDGQPRVVVAEVGTGELKVIVPPALPTTVKAHIGAGATSIFGRAQSGLGVHVGGSHRGEEGRGRLDLDLDVGLGQINVELATAPTFRVACQVPVGAKGDGSDPVTCPHPPRLVGQPMACSVVLADPDGGGLGQAFCRLGGNTVPAIGRFAAFCTVAGESDQASCAPLEPERRLALQELHRSVRPPEVIGPPEPVDPASPPTPGVTTTPAAPAAGTLTCGPPDATGARLCTPSASTTTTAAPQFRCTEDPATKQLSCVPA